MKRCTSCGIAKLPTAFGKQKNTRDGTYHARAECKDCRCEDEKARYYTITDAQKQTKKNTFLLRTYGITLETYNDMFSLQMGICPGCGRHQSELAKALVVDHDHKTNKVRGLLCSACNLALGSIKDKPSTLLNLVEYLRKS